MMIKGHMTCSHCGSTDTQLLAALCKVKVDRIDNGKPVYKEIEVYRCAACNRTFDEEEGGEIHENNYSDYCNDTVNLSDRSSDKHENPKGHLREKHEERLSKDPNKVKREIVSDTTIDRNIELKIRLVKEKQDNGSWKIIKDKKTPFCEQSQKDKSKLKTREPSDK